MESIRLWYMNATISTAVIGSMGKISNRGNEYVDEIPAILKVYEFQNK